MCYMNRRGQAVGVRELRQNLSVYLRRVKAGETLEVRERGHRIAVLAPSGARLTALERLVSAGRATAAIGDLLDLGPPLGPRPARRASRALAQLREERRSR
jgi:prevent-host-death family protein